MADSKIKVNELQTATPELTDTLLASGADKEYACRISDLKDVIGGGGDWNSNEGESGYIANRTHYVENNPYEHICSLPDGFADGLSYGDIYNDESPSDDDLFDAIYNAYIENIPVYGENYDIGRGTIVINDTAYECNISAYSNNDGAYWHVNFADDEWYSYMEIEYSGDYKYIGYNPVYYTEGQNKTEVPVITIHKLDLTYIPVSELNIPKPLQNIADSGGSGIIEGSLYGSDANTASGQYTHAEGFHTTASANRSHAEGNKTNASGEDSHAEGTTTRASGVGSHAEGNDTTASGYHSHTEGYRTTASGKMSHAEGSNTTASDQSSHAEGEQTTASGRYSHAEGGYTTASGWNSHAEGYYTTANHSSQHVFGEYNIADPSNAIASNRGTYIEIVGNGDYSVRRNARTLDWSGNEWLAGKMTANGGIVLKSPDGSFYTLTMNNDGTLNITKNV